MREADIERAIRGDDVPRNIGRARLFTAAAILVAFLLISTAGAFLASAA